MSSLKDKLSYLERELEALDIKRALYVKQIKILKEASTLSYMIEPDNLSPRQNDVYQCLLRGMLDKEIARELNISMNTVKKHCGNIYCKLGLKKGRKDLIRRGGLNGP